MNITPSGSQISDSASKVWKPHDKQIEFLQIPDSIEEALYGGAAGGGKTELLLMYPILKGWTDNPRFKGIAFRRSFPELEASLIERSKEWYPLFGARFHETKHVWYFPSGATMRFGFIERDEDARAYDTAEFNYVAFDELTHFTDFQYLYIVLQRRRTVKNSGLPAVARSATNPGNIGNEWVRDRFVKPFKIGGKVLVDPETKMKRIFIPAKVSDNPYMDPNYEISLRAIPSEAERKAKLEGDFWAFTGQVFTEFRIQRYDSEPENACHIIQDPTGSVSRDLAQNWWPKFLVIDWGFDHYTWAGWSTISPDNRSFLYREYMCRKKKIAEWAADLARLTQYDNNLTEVHLDPSAWQERGLEHTIAGQFATESGFDPLKANNDRIGGKLLIHEYLRWTKKEPRYIPQGGYNEEMAQKILRVRGLAAFKDYGKLFTPEPPELNLPKAQILSHCTGVIDTIPKCMYNKAPKGQGNTEDIQKFDGDDPYDGYRYTQQAINSYIDANKEEAARREKLGAIISAREQDQTAFYQRMSHLEAQQTNKVVPFSISAGRRGHRRVIRAG